jgi:hypothetical protein
MPDATDKREPLRADPYVIRIKGHLDPRWSEWFEGLTVTQTESGETVLSGPVVDQSALHGLLARIRDLNLTLVSVTWVEPKHSHEG